jgi:hypothetical protein
MDNDVVFDEWQKDVSKKNKRKRAGPCRYY